jgi:glyoxylase-like metal-dependent hydrolase (beta-lactamase superfamily II)
MAVTEPEDSVYERELLVVGYPGVTRGRGGLGWSTIALLHSVTRTVLVDTGGPNSQPVLLEALERVGIAREQITDVLLTHCHWDHIYNITLFPQARLVVGGEELTWARRQAPGTWQLADLHVDWLTRQHGRLVEIADGDEPVPGIRAVATPGHTPGHLAYHLAGPAGHLYAGDAVKNRAELVTGEVDMSLNAAASRHSIGLVQDLLAGQEDLRVIPGHDVPMRLERNGLRLYGRSRAALTVQLSADGQGVPTEFDLSEPER